MENSLQEVFLLIKLSWRMVGDEIDDFLHGEINDLCHNFNAELAKSALKLGCGLINTYQPLGRVIT